MRGDSRALCKKMLKVHGIPINKKVNVIQTFILTRGTFQCGTWPALSDVQYKRFHGSILKLYRDATGNSFKLKSQDDDGAFDVSSMFNDDEVIYRYGFMCPKTMLRLARLSLFVRIIMNPPPSFSLTLVRPTTCLFLRRVGLPLLRAISFGSLMLKPSVCAVVSTFLSGVISLLFPLGNT